MAHDTIFYKQSNSRKIVIFIGHVDDIILDDEDFVEQEKVTKKILAKKFEIKDLGFLCISWVWMWQRQRNPSVS